ncbi:MAG: DUF4079 domain-containing protein [Desulfonatronovibrio sp.]
MLWLHPVIQLSAIAMGFYVLFLAWPRFKALHLKKPGKFEWKKHAFWGRIIIIVLLGGFVLGRVAVQSQWEMSPVFLKHNQAAVIMILFLIIAYLTGSIMDRRKKKRFWLPVVHGINNLTLLGLGLYQTYTGYLIVKDFVI